MTGLEQETDQLCMNTDRFNGQFEPSRSLAPVDRQPVGEQTTNVTAVEHFEMDEDPSIVEEIEQCNCCDSQSVNGTVRWSELFFLSRKSGIW